LALSWLLDRSEFDALGQNLIRKQLIELDPRLNAGVPAGR
jgi:hypothetical protein